MVCGAEHVAEVEVFGQAKQDWRNTFKELNNRISSHDAFAQVLAIMKS